MEALELWHLSSNPGQYTARHTRSTLNSSSTVFSASEMFHCWSKLVFSSQLHSCTDLRLLHNCAEESSQAKPNCFLSIVRDSPELLTSQNPIRSIVRRLT